jgi:hypothetical protein
MVWWWLVVVVGSGGGAKGKKKVVFGEFVEFGKCGKRRVDRGECGSLWWVNLV